MKDKENVKRETCLDLEYGGVKSMHLREFVGTLPVYILSLKLKKSEEKEKIKYTGLCV